AARTQGSGALPARPGPPARRARRDRPPRALLRLERDAPRPGTRAHRPAADSRRSRGVDARVRPAPHRRRSRALVTPRPGCSHPPDGAGDAIVWWTASISSTGLSETSPTRSEARSDRRVSRGIAAGAQRDLTRSVVPTLQISAFANWHGLG